MLGAIVTDESDETKIALLEHRMKAIEEDLSTMKAWSFKAAISVIGTLALTYWDKFQSALKGLAK